MANRLKMNMVQAVVALFEQNWSQRRIAGELGIDRETVSRYLKRWQNSKPAIVHTGSLPASDPLLGGLPGPGLVEPSGPATDSAGRLSECAPFRDLILAKLDQGLSAHASGRISRPSTVSSTATTVCFALCKGWCRVTSCLFAGWSVLLELRPRSISAPGLPSKPPRANGNVLTFFASC